MCAVSYSLIWTALFLYVHTAVRWKYLGYTMGEKGDQRGKQRTFGQSVEAISTKRSNHLLLKECRPQRTSGEINLFCGIKATVNVPSIRGDMKHSTNICQSRHMCSVCNDCMEKQSVVPQGEISQTSVEWLRVVIGILLAWKTNWIRVLKCQ